MSFRQIKALVSSATISGLVLTLALGLVGCSSLRYPVEAKLSGETIRTTVDSQEAAYYLGQHIMGQSNQPELDRFIESLLPQDPAASLPTSQELQQTSIETTVDFAAIHFADRVRRHPDNLAFENTFIAYLDGPPPPDAPQRKDYANYIALFAPGWDYLDNGHLTGSDLARPIEIANGIGIESHLIPLVPTGSVETNAPIAQNAIEEALASGKNVIVVSASSSGPIIHVALDRIRSSDAPPPSAWINLGGILKGTPLYETYQRFPKNILAQFVYAIEGWRKSDLASMGRKASSKRFATLQLDADTLVINYIGLSLSGNLSKYARRTYPALKPFGPNDGLTPLADIAAAGGLTLIAPNSDHFFAEDPRIDQKTVALAKAVIHLLEASRP